MLKRCYSKEIKLSTGYIKMIQNVEIFKALRIITIMFFCAKTKILCKQADWALLLPKQAEYKWNVCLRLVSSVSVSTLSCRLFFFSFFCCPMLFQHCFFKNHFLLVLYCEGNKRKHLTFCCIVSFEVSLWGETVCRVCLKSVKSLFWTFSVKCMYFLQPSPLTFLFFFVNTGRCKSDQTLVWKARTVKGNTAKLYH